MDGFAAFTYQRSDAQNPICSTAHDVPSSEMLYFSSTTAEHFERRSRESKAS
jgi:hypothetical protein